MTQLNIRGSVTQKNVIGSITQKRVLGSMSEGGHTSNAPAFASSEVGTVSDIILMLTMDRNLYEYSVPDASDFTLSFSGGAVTVTGVTLFSSSTDIQLDLSRAIVYGETGTVTYTPGTYPLKSLVGGDSCIGFTSQTVTNNVAASYPAALSARHFWYDPSDSDTITGFGGTATRVNDKLGNGNDLVTGSCQSTANTLLLNGTSHYLKTGAIAGMTQPTMIYMIIKQVTWTANDRIFSGLSNGFGECYQSPGTPALRIASATVLGNNLNLVLDTWSVLRVKFNGAASTIQVDDNAALTGDAGLLDMGGFVLGARGDGLIQFSNIQVKDNIAMPSDTGEVEIYNWLVTRL